MLFLKTIPDALRIFYKNIAWVLACVGLDTVFMILLNVVFLNAYLTVMVRIEEIQKILTQNLNLVVEQVGEQELMSHIVNNQDVLMGHYKEILLWIGIFIAAGFIAWLLTQTLTWWIAHRLNKTKVKFLKFFGMFSLGSFVGLVILISSVYLTVKLMNLTSQMPMPIISIQTIAYIPIAAGSILSYFVLTFYAVIGLKKPVEKGVCVLKNFMQTVPMFLIGMLILFSIHFALFMVAQINPAITLIGVVFVLLPYLALMRIYFCDVVKKVCD